MNKKTSAGAALAIAIAITSAPTLADETGTAPVTLPEVQVEGLSINPAIYTTEPGITETAPYADGGEFLRSIPGVSSGRMGGHGLEPVIRGQQQNRLNVIGDGAIQYGACPNRMDPSTSITSFESYDEVVVLRGYQTVTNGPGGTGGTIEMVRHEPEFMHGKAYEGEFSMGGNSNGSLKESSLSFAHDLNAGYVRFDAGFKDAGNYKDARGDKVRSAFEQHSGVLEFGWRPDVDTLITLSQEADQSRDVLFAGAGMDTPEADSQTTRMAMKTHINSDVVRSIDVSAFGSFTDHLMDNYSLRSFGMMTMKTNSLSDTLGAQISADLNVGGVAVTTGADIQHNTRDATRYRGTNAENLNTVHAYMWPDLAIMQTGLFAESTLPIDKVSRLTVGARYDYVQADAGKVDKTARPSGSISRSANDLYDLYYGKRMDNVAEHNLGGLVRYEQDWGASLQTYATFSRSVRTADATERGMAGDHATDASRWVGNPDIAPEKHHQLELGTTLDTNGWLLEASAYHDWVNDFIFRDRARGQDGILLSDGATVYRNVDARLWGLEIGANTRIFEKWVLGANAAYTYGRNADTGLPLPQIPPLSMALNLAYEHDDWLFGTRIDAALRQSRVDNDTDTGSGLDVRKTPGYVVPGLYGAYSGLDPVTVRFGVTNLLDHSYANHLNRSNSFDTDQAQVSEPGRSFYLQVSTKF